MRGLYVVSSGGDSEKSDNKHSLPFYWGDTSEMTVSSSSDLNDFIFDYYLTGYRRARDHILQFAEGMKRYWTPERAKSAWRSLMVMRLLTQAYAFTWDRELRAMAEATTDTFIDPECQIGLTKERPYRSSTYKTQVDIAGLLDAWEILGAPRYYDLSMKVARYWWGNLLGRWPIFHTNPQGRIGSFLYRQTRDPSYAQGLLIQLKQATTITANNSASLTGGHGKLSAEKCTFIFQGIPYAERVIVDAGADRGQVASWVGCDDFRSEVTIVVRKGDDERIELDLKTDIERVGSAGGVRLRPIAPASSAGMDLNWVWQGSSGVVKVCVPKDAPAGDYEIVPAVRGTLLALAHSRVPLVLHAPNFWRPYPRQAPTPRWYFLVPDHSNDAQIFFERPTKLYSPNGQPWPEDNPVSGWVDLPATPGLWSFKPVSFGLVRVRNLPPFFAVGDRASYFEPKIPWSRQPLPTPPEPVPKETSFVQGAIHTPGNKALFIGDKRHEFYLDAGPPHPTGDGSQFLPRKHGTIEFFFKPSWSTFDLPPKSLTTILLMPSKRYTWRLHYVKEPDAGQWFLSHVLYGIFMSDGPMGRVIMRSYRRTIFIRDRWVHIAWVWGIRKVPSFKKAEATEVLTGRLYVDGREGQQFCYRWEGQHAADAPVQFVLPATRSAFDELRISDVQRYRTDFTPPTRESEFRLDERTRALFHFNGNLRGQSYGYEAAPPVRLGRE